MDDVKGYLRAACMLLVLVLMGCEKPVLPAEEVPEEKGNLRVRVFQVGQTPFDDATPSTDRTTTATGSDAFSRLCFAVYDLSGRRVKQVNQVKGDPSFGACTVQLEEGTYQVVVVGHSSHGNPTMTDLTSIRFSNTQGFTDTFLYCGQVEIGDSGQEVQASLNRIVALCRLVLTDDYPAAVTTMRCTYTGGSGAFNAKTGLGCVNSKQVVTWDVTAGQKQIDLFTFLHETEGTIHLVVTALDAQGQEQLTREFDVPLAQNKVTWLSGPFFSASAATTITVTVNAKWGGETRVDL